MMIDLYHARINTAGAYVCVQGLYVFALGVQLHQGRIPVYRLGGHREQGETGWQCAQREVAEETGLVTQPLAPPVTYYTNGDQVEAGLQTVQWEHADGGEAVPWLVVSYQRDGQTLLSLMYHAQAEQLPTPSGEVHGLLLLDPPRIHGLCAKPRTLEQYLQAGGQAILNADFDRSLFLEPFLQVRLLAQILEVGLDES